MMTPDKLPLVHTLLSKLSTICSITTTFFLFFKTFSFMTTLILICGKKEPQTVNNSLEKMAPIFAFPRTSIIFKLILKTRDVGGLVIFTFPMHRELLTVGVVWGKKLVFTPFCFDPPPFDSWLVDSVANTLARWDQFHEKAYFQGCPSLLEFL